MHHTAARHRAGRWRTVIRVLALSAGGAAWLLALSLADGPSVAGFATVTPLLSKNLSTVQGKELSLITLDYAPGAKEPAHTHPAEAVVYVVEGSIVMQVQGGEPVTLEPGEAFYEGPDDIQVVGRNRSATKPARIVMFLVKNQGAPTLVPEE